MAIKLFEERFDKPYNGVTPSVLLQPGQISDGQNVRRAGNLGGWKSRKGCRLLADHNLDQPWWPINFSDLTWAGGDEGNTHDVYGEGFVAFAVDSRDDVWGYLDLDDDSSGADYFRPTDKFSYIFTFRIDAEDGGTVGIAFADTQSTGPDGLQAITNDGQGLKVTIGNDKKISLQAWSHTSGTGTPSSISGLHLGQEYTVLLIRDEKEAWLFVYNDRNMTDLFDSAYVNDVEDDSSTASELRYVLPFVSESAPSGGGDITGMFRDAYITFPRFPAFPMASESDAAGRVTVYAEKVVVSNLDTDEDSYLCFDMGEDFFSGSFTVKITLDDASFTGTSGTEDRFCHIFGMSNTKGILADQTDYIALRLYHSGTAQFSEFYMEEYGNDIVDDDTSTVFQLDGADSIELYIVRDESVGENGVLRLQITSNILLEIPLENARDYRYLYILSGGSDAGMGGDAFSFTITDVAIYRDVYYYDADNTQYDVSQYAKIKTVHELNEIVTGEKQLIVQHGDKLIEAMQFPPLPTYSSSVVTPEAFGSCFRSHIPAKLCPDTDPLTSDARRTFP